MEPDYSKITASVSELKHHYVMLAIDKKDLLGILKVFDTNESNLTWLEIEESREQVEEALFEAEQLMEYLEKAIAIKQLKLR